MRRCRSYAGKAWPFGSFSPSETGIAWQASSQYRCGECDYNVRVTYYAISAREGWSKGALMSKRIVGSSVLAASALSLIFAATHDFVPDVVFRPSSLEGMRTISHAAWSISSGEITGTPKDQDGGWLVLDKS